MAFGQTRIGDWKIHSSTLEIMEVASGADGEIYCATEGGLLKYIPETGELSTETSLNGLYRTSISSVYSPDGSTLWIGGQNPDGFIQVIDAISGNTVFIFDQGLTEVTEFHVMDSIAFAIYRMNQEIGLVKFIIEDQTIEYRDFYRNWPAEISSITSITTLGSELYIGTNIGIYSANYKAGNLKDPNQWYVSSVFPNGKNSWVISDTSRIIAVAGDSLYQFNMENDGVETWFLEDDLNILGLDMDSEGDIWILTSRNCYKLSGNVLSTMFSVNGKYPLNLEVNDNFIYVGTLSGLFIYGKSGGSISIVAPNTLVSNDISAVLMKSDGRVVAAGRRGLSILEDSGWRNIVSKVNSDFTIYDDHDMERFAADTIPVHFGGFIADIEEGPDGRVYCAVRGTYPEPRLPGGGIISIDIDNPEDVILIDTTHLDYFGNEYMVVKDIEFDNFGAMWVADAYATKKNIPIHAMNPNGTWEHYVTTVSQDMGLTPNSLAFDSWGRLWIASFRDDAINGSFMDGGLSMMSQDGSEYTFTEVTSHPDNSMRTVWSVDISSDDRLYALTPSGLAIMDLSSSNTSPVTYRNPLLYFSNIPFSEGSRVKLDPRENAWVLSSSEGIHVLKENTSFWPDNDPDVAVEKISVDNSPLLSDQVTDIDFNSERGLAVISSSRGINILKIPFADKYSTMSDIKIFPSPYFLPSNLPMIISGLMDKSSIRIMSITGYVFRTLDYSEGTDNGYQISWDGRDESGNYVGTGVYLIGIFEPGGKVHFEKVAVIQK